MTLPADGLGAVERHESIAPVAADWDALADRAGAAPFLRPGWFEAWFAAFSPGRPAILAVRRGERLAGVLPLVRRRGVLAAAANWHTPLYGSLADGPDAAAALAEAALAARAGRVDLTMADPDDPIAGALRSASARTIERVVARQPYVDLSSGLEAYEAGLARKHRKEIGRLRRRLAGEGDLSFHFDDGTEGLDGLLEEGFRIEGSGWKSEQGSAIASRPDTRAFYTEVARWAAARGWLRLAFLRLDGRPLAFDLCIESAGAVYALKGGFDVDFRRFGPGTVLTHESLVRAFAGDLRSYEFLGTDAGYKLDWASTVRERARIQAFGGSPLGRLQHAAWRHGRPLAKRLLTRGGKS